MRPWRLLIMSTLALPIIYCQNTHTPRKPQVLEPVANVDYGDLTLGMINEFVLMVQMFLTCVPSVALPPVTPDFMKISCLFNMMSTFSLVSLNVLNGWDRLDESRTFKMQMRRVFNQWAEEHEKRDFMEMSHLKEIREWTNFLELHFDMYVAHYSDKEQGGEQHRLMCAFFEMGESIFTNRGFVQEVCVTKAGIRKLGENKLSRLPLENAIKVAKFLGSGGLIKAANNPPLYMLKLIKTYGELTADVLQRLQTMASSVQSETDTFTEQGYNFHDDGKLLMTMRLIRPHGSN